MLFSRKTEKRIENIQKYLITSFHMILFLAGAVYLKFPAIFLSTPLFSFFLPITAAGLIFLTASLAIGRLLNNMQKGNINWLIWGTNILTFLLCIAFTLIETVTFIMHGVSGILIGLPLVLTILAGLFLSGQLYDVLFYREQSDFDGKQYLFGIIINVAMILFLNIPSPMVGLISGIIICAGAAIAAMTIVRSLYKDNKQLLDNRLDILLVLGITGLVVYHLLYRVTPFFAPHMYFFTVLLALIPIFVLKHFNVLSHFVSFTMSSPKISFNFYLSYFLNPLAQMLLIITAGSLFLINPLNTGLPILLISIGAGIDALITGISLYCNKPTAFEVKTILTMVSRSSLIALFYAPIYTLPAGLAFSLSTLCISAYSFYKGSESMSPDDIAIISDSYEPGIGSAHVHPIMQPAVLPGSQPLAAAGQSNLLRPPAGITSGSPGAPKGAPVSAGRR